MIKVENLKKEFGDFLAVNDISFDIKKGEIFAFLGPNGAGKSTTIKMLTTVLNPTSGVILVDGKSPTKDPAGVRRSFGIVFQDPSLDDDLTALENMELHSVLYDIPKADRKIRIEELLKFVELWERRKNLVKDFSGGMKRRLEIARGLLHHPKVMFLDEPTLGLDPQTRNRMWDYLRKLNKEEGTTIFFTTHYMEEADKVADRIAVIDGGNIVAMGSPKELKEENDTDTLEEAFLKLTGKTIREEVGDSKAAFRHRARMWRGGRK